jgi:hypothetical protein
MKNQLNKFEDKLRDYIQNYDGDGFTFNPEYKVKTEKKIPMFKRGFSVAFICIAICLSIITFITYNKASKEIISSTSNVHVSSEQTSSVSSVQNVGGDSYKYKKHVEGYFSVDGFVIDYIDSFGKDKFQNEFAKMYVGTQDFNTGFVCEYYGISKEKYIEIISPILDSSDKSSPINQIHANYEVWFSSDYDNYSGYINSDYVAPGIKPETIRFAEDKEHTNRYYTIDSKLIQYVGEAKYNDFKNKYKETKDFNILNFVKYFNISKDSFREIIGYTPDAIHQEPVAYNANYVFGTEEMQTAYFTRNPLIK